MARNGRRTGSMDAVGARDLQSHSLTIIQQRENDLTRQLAGVRKKENELSTWETELLLTQQRLKDKEFGMRLRETQIDAREMAMRDRERRVNDDEARLKAALAEVERLKKHTVAMEMQRRARRTNSEAHIEDTFPALRPPDMVKLLSHSSDRLRRHAIQTLRDSIEGGIVRVQNPAQPADLAPLLLSTLAPLLISPQPDVVRFAVDVLQHPKLSLEFARSGECPKLLELLRNSDPEVRNAALVSLRRILQCNKPMRGVLAPCLLPYIKNPDELSEGFVHEALQRVVADLLEDEQYTQAVGLAFVDHKYFRDAVIPTVSAALKGSQSLRHREGVVQAGILDWFEKFLDITPTPTDIVNFFYNSIPLLAIQLSLRGQDRRIIELMWHPTHAVSQTAVLTLRTVASGPDDRKLSLVQAGLLPHLESRMEPSESPQNVLEFACDVIPMLGVLFARNGDCGRLIELLEHHYVPIRAASMSAFNHILASSEGDRNKLRDAVMPLLLGGLPIVPSRFPLIESSLPVLTADLIAGNSLPHVIKLITHNNSRVRILCAPPFLRAIGSQPQIRQNLIQNDFMSTLLQLCSSSQEDSINFAAESLPQLALDLVHAGYADKIIRLLMHDSDPIRESARAAILVVSKGSITEQRVLVSSNIELALATQLQDTHPNEEVIEFIVRFVLNMAMVFGESPDQCEFLLDSLSHPQPRIRDASTQALHVVLRTDTATRKPLRTALFSKLDSGPEPLLEFAASTIANCVYNDLIQDNNFPSIFHFLFHTDFRIRSTTTACVTASIQNSPPTRNAIGNAGFLKRIIKALDSSQLYPDILAWCSSSAFPRLSIAFAETGHSAEVVQLLHRSESSLRSAAVGMLNEIADSSPTLNKALIEAGLLTELLVLLENSDDLITEFTFMILPKVVLSISRAGEIERVVDLLDHDAPPIRGIAATSLDLVLQKDLRERQQLRNILITRLLGDPSRSVCDFASAAFGDVLCEDILHDRDFPILFEFLGHKDTRLRVSAISALANAMAQSDTFREDLCGAGFLSRLVLLLDNPSPEILIFASTQALPVLSLSLSRGGECQVMIRLLSHRRPEVRAGASAALKIIAKTSDADRTELVASNLMSELAIYLRQPDEILVDFCATVLPALGTFIADRGEVDRLLMLQSHPYDRVSTASLLALRSILNSAQAEKIALVHGILPMLPNPPPTNAPFICEAIPVLGTTLLDIGQGEALLSLLWSTDESIRSETEDVIKRVAAGPVHTYKKDLIKAGLITTLVQLLDDVELQDSAASLATYVAPHVSLQALENGACPTLVSLLRFQDRDLSRALDTSIREISNTASSRTLIDADIIPELLISHKDQPDPTVSELICFLCLKLAVTMIEMGKFRDMVDLLSHPEATVRRACALALMKIAGGQESSKDALFNTAGFLDRLRESLEKIHPSELCSTIKLLALQSVIRSNIFLESGFGGPLIRLITDFSNKDAHIAALEAISALTGNLADSTPLIRADLLRSLAINIDHPLAELDVIRTALQITEHVAQSKTHRFAITTSPLRGSVVKCLSFDDTVVLTLALKISEQLASETDAEVKALIQEGILIPLVPLIEHHLSRVVILACGVVQGLARSGTYRQNVIDSGARKALKNVTSLTRRSKMASTEDKKGAQKAADAALDVLGTRFAEIMGKRPTSKGKHKSLVVPVSPMYPTSPSRLSPSSPSHLPSVSEFGVSDELYGSQIFSDTSSSRRGYAATQ